MSHSGDRYSMPDGLGEYLLVRSNAETGGLGRLLRFETP
jgi:hypothetical protein